MTAQTEVLPQAPQPPAKQGSALAVSLSSGAILTGLASWAGGVALHAGYHVSVPFLATWLGLMVTAVTTSHFTSIVARMWHHEKGLTAAQLAGQVKVMETIGEAAAKDALARQAAK